VARTQPGLALRGASGAGGSVGLLLDLFVVGGAQLHAAEEGSPGTRTQAAQALWDVGLYGQHGYGGRSLELNKTSYFLDTHSSHRLAFPWDTAPVMTAAP